MYIKYRLTESDIMNLHSLSKVLKCDKIVYDRNYINQIIGVGPDFSYYQTISGFELDLSPDNNDVMVNVLDIKNLSKESQPAEVVADYDFIRYIKGQVDSCRSNLVDNNIRYTEENFHENEAYLQLMATGSSDGAMPVTIGNDWVYLTKSFLPTNKSDKLTLTTYNIHENYPYKIMKLTIFKPKGIIINQYSLYL